VALWGDARAGLEALHLILERDAQAIRARREDYAATSSSAWRPGTTRRGSAITSEETPVGMGRLMGELNALMPEDGILVADGGFAAHWAGCSTTPSARAGASSRDRGFASIGYGLPGAMGAALAAPGRTVVSLTGDGGFNMMLGELETAAAWTSPSRSWS
jgi:acetolactate synthase-1/2/3 large subunit